MSKEKMGWGWAITDTLVNSPAGGILAGALIGLLIELAGTSELTLPWYAKGESVPVVVFLAGFGLLAHLAALFAQAAWQDYGSKKGA